MPALKNCSLQMERSLITLEGLSPDCRMVNPPKKRTLNSCLRLTLPALFADKVTHPEPFWLSNVLSALPEHRQSPPLTGTYRAPTASNPAASTTTANAAVNELAVAMPPISGGPIMKPL